MVLLKWSFFGPFFTQKSFCREMCNIVNTRFLRPFGVIMEIKTESPQKLYNGSFFYSKVLFFPIEKFFTSSPQNKISFWEALGTEPSQFLQAHHSAQRRQEPGSGEMCRGNGGQFCRGTGSVTSILTQVQRYCRLSEAKRAEAEQKQTHVCADLG